jgi:predicted transcriptional regulator
VKSIETLQTLTEKSSPGRAPEFTSAHLLMSLKIIKDSTIGRKQLAEKLGLGEGTIRNLIRRLMDEDLVSSNRQGMSLTQKGFGFLNDINKKIVGAPFKGTEITVARYNYFVLVRGERNRIRYGVEQRDSALIAGARGATTLIFKNGELIMPGMEGALEESEIKQIMSLSPQNEDVIIIGTANTPLYAETGAYSAALNLLLS